MNKIILELTPEQAREYSAALTVAFDRGDGSERWKSEPLAELEKLIDDAIEASTQKT